MSDYAEVGCGTDTIPVALKKLEDGRHVPIYASSIVSRLNGTVIALDDAEVFTGEWEDVGHWPNVTVAVKTDQNGYFTIQFSPDGVNQDSTLTRYYRPGQIEPPHNFTITRQYCRVVFTNDSGSNQTYLRLQTLYGDKPQLNAPLDSTLAQDFDAVATRPSDYGIEVSLGIRQGAELWNKWGYNPDVDVGTEVVASWGGTFAINTTARTLSIVSDSTDDDDGGTGCNSVVLYGLNENWKETIEVVTLNGTTPVVTTSTWIGINRIAMFLCGTGQGNAGTITATKVTDGDMVGQLPVGEGVTQQCIFYVPVQHQFQMEWMLLNTARQAAQNPYVEFKVWVYSTVNNGKQEVFRKAIDTSVQISHEVHPKRPFPIGEKSIVWIEATTDKTNTEVNARFSGILTKDADHI